MGLFNINPSSKNPLLERFCNAVRLYQEHFGVELDSSTMCINEQTITDIEKCIKENVRLEKIWPELKTIQEADDI